MSKKWIFLVLLILGCGLIALAIIAGLLVVSIESNGECKYDAPFALNDAPACEDKDSNDKNSVNDTDTSTTDNTTDNTDNNDSETNTENDTSANVPEGYKRYSDSEMSFIYPDYYGIDYGKDGDVDLLFVLPNSEDSDNTKNYLQISKTDSVYSLNDTVCEDYANEYIDASRDIVTGTISDDWTWDYNPLSNASTCNIWFTVYTDENTEDYTEYTIYKWVDNDLTSSYLFKIILESTDANFDRNYYDFVDVVNSFGLAI